ncbi:Vacuolar protein sorting-associated protein 45 [Armadillidium nasatum]|uniref:Vacuolar protein sorting-associated protein 45 n=1 Tax=Armadillidium nasatum TaxID=96803 RepID=A0A5N5SI03_9CRUS|nr:Vacuolar protein sorting-associated protein 45 [Armadillidium nasatum]
MSLTNLMKCYINKMIKESEPGYKVMLLDKYTTSLISLIMGMNEIMKEEVYLFEQLGQVNYSENMAYLKCIVFVRPTSTNVAALCQELQKPRYGSYYLNFSNSISKSDVKLLAESDEHEVVQEIHEIYADFLVHTPHLFSLSLPNCLQGQKWDSDALQRCIQGVAAVCFSLHIMPIIRYQNNSELCSSLAENVMKKLIKEGLVCYDSPVQNNSLLLILDRQEDPVTPLLHQWTYEAMVHELLGVHNGRVKIEHERSSSREEVKEFVMIPCQDDFYLKCMYLNYGDIGQTIKELMEEYQQKLSKQQNVESLSDMKKFVENYPEFKKMSGTVSKHVTILGELSRIVSSNKLLEISECEQELVCGTEINFQRIKQLVSSHEIREKDAVKLVMLYALKHQRSHSNDVKTLISILKKKNVSDTSLKTSIPQDVSSIRRRFFKGIKGVDNVYTQHKPLLTEILNSALRGRLKETQFPYCGTGNSGGALESSCPKSILVFMVGGITYEEAYAVHLLNSSSRSVKIYLGGNYIHNSQSFIDSINGSLSDHRKSAFNL